MLTESKVTAILPVKRMERAREFYEKKLGLKPKGFSSDGSLLFACGGDALIALIPKAEGTLATHTALSFEVGDIRREIRELERRGVRFEDYDLPSLKTVDHVCAIGDDKAAWFQDTEGNILCVHQSAGG